MPHWTVDAPVSLDFDAMTQLNVRLIGGTVAVLATDEKPSLVVSEIQGRPLEVDYADGVLTVSYANLSWDRLLDFLKPRGDVAAVTITVPPDCPVQLGVVSASALVSGLNSGASVKGVSGDITLDGVAGDVAANTVSGELQARDIDGAVDFATVSGELTLADSSISGLAAESVSGQVTADVTLAATGAAKVSTVSGGVTLRLPAECDAEVRLSSMSGKIRSEFDSLRIKNAPASHTASGNVGAGTGHVSLSTVSGAITLLRRPDRRTPARAETEPSHADAGMESETR
jgi:hypothetical protein